MKNGRHTRGRLASCNIKSSVRWHPQEEEWYEHGCAGTTKGRRTWRILHSTQALPGIQRNYRFCLNRAIRLKEHKYSTTDCCLMQPLSTLRLHHGCMDCTKNLGGCWICKGDAESGSPRGSFYVLCKKQCVRPWKQTAGEKQWIN